MTRATTLSLLALSLAASGQNFAPKDSERDPVLSALLDAGTADEDPSVTVDLAADAGPVLVTGNLPEGAAPLATGTEERPQPEEAEGVKVEVEAGRSNARVAASDIRIVAPFPAKPLAEPPIGWQLVQPDNVPPISKTVELANGSEIRLSVRPHVLIPDADGDRVIEIAEPGYDPSLQYGQRDTVGSILADSIHALDENSDRLAAAARRLDELLISLPAASEPVDALDETTEAP